MIQIQDDNFNQSATTSSSSQSSTQSTVADHSYTADSKNDNTSEIDHLLEELEKLSKNLDEDSTSKSETATVAPEVSKVVESTQPVSAEKTAPVMEEKKFDFDTFLSDLEKKIDQNTDKNPNEQQPDFADAENSSDMNTDLGLDAESTDFRKNRGVTDLQVQDEDTKEMTNEAASASMPIPETDSEELKAQNIFDMLGLANIEDEEKNKFLDDLESMIWDDFVFHDLELLLTSEEYTGARQILDDNSKSKEQQKEDLITYLEKLVPDLDEVLYDKALELKSEMMGERLAKMKEDADEATLAEIKKAEGLISQNRWKSAVTLLNQL